MRYSSGTSLQRTPKEERLDYFERMVGQGEEFPDELYNELKKLTVTAIQELHRQVQARINTTFHQDQLRAGDREATK